MKVLKCLLAACLLALGAPTVWSTALPPSAAVVPEGLPSQGVPILAYVSGNFDFGSGPGHITGSYVQGVAVDPFGLTCAGCLDFFVNVNLDGGLQSGILDVQMGRFSGFTVGVGYILPGSDGSPDRSPALALWAAQGVEFEFIDPANPTDFSHIIGPGNDSVVVVATNATTFGRNGYVDLSGGRDSSQASIVISGLYSPVAVPEAATWSSFGLGLAGIALALRRRSGAN